MPDLGPLLGHLEATRRAMLGEAATIPDDAFSREPEPGAWSAAHVLAHLHKLESGVVLRFRGMVAGRIPSTVALGDRLRCLPPRLVAMRLFKVRHPKIVDPGVPPPRPQALAQLATSRAALLAFVEETRAQDLSRLRFVHPVLGGLDVYAWMWMLGYHEERHRKQLVDIRLAIGRAS